MGPLNMDIPEIEEEEYANFLGVESNSLEVELTTQSSHNYEDGTEFYKSLSFKNKRELVVLKLLEVYEGRSYCKGYGNGDSGAWGFLFMRKVIAIDEIFLMRKYRGVLLSAVAHIHPDSVELCIISDRHISIANGISKFYPQAHHGFCMKRLAENIRKHFHCGVYHYYSAAKAYRIDEFNDHFQQIKDNDVRVAKYLQEDVGFHKWSKAHFPCKTSCRNGNAVTCFMYEVLTTNIFESVNSIFLLEREFLITALFDAISRRFSQKFHERRMQFLDTSTICVPSVEKKINRNANLGNRLLVHPIRQQVFNITCHGAVAKVDLRNRICSCRKFDLDKIPCPHAMAALRVEFGAQYRTSIYDYTSDFYYIDTYVNAYAIEINPVPSEECWEVPPELVERKIPPPSC
ncbi:uncharacterized protein LOC142169715 [Nicotiana tabacum]|uniref:Uncharacterized protein LOC142169715 n=1 Tax=Nicotiana tabacum TaxID=4097 RepID=A0AC58SRY3_TOBAC